MIISSPLIVKSSAITRQAITILPIVLEIPSWLFAPYKLATLIEKPCANPITTLRSIHWIQPAAPILAKAFTPKNCPTIIVSTIV